MAAELTEDVTGPLRISSSGVCCCTFSVSTSSIELLRRMGDDTACLFCSLFAGQRRGRRQGEEGRVGGVAAKTLVAFLLCRLGAGCQKQDMADYQSLRHSRLFRCSKKKYSDPTQLVHTNSRNRQSKQVRNASRKPATQSKKAAICTLRTVDTSFLAPYPEDLSDGNSESLDRLDHCLGLQKPSVSMLFGQRDHAKLTATAANVVRKKMCCNSASVSAKK